MKKKNIELDVDFIGGEEPLTQEEEKALSDLLQSKKEQSGRDKPRKRKRA